MTAPGRTVNLVVPVELPGHPVSIRLAMSEADARAVANTSDHMAGELGPLFVLVKESLTEFLFQEG